MPRTRRWPSTSRWSRTPPAGLEGLRSVRVAHRSDGTSLALFESEFHVRRVTDEQPEILLDKLLSH